MNGDLPAPLRVSRLGAAVLVIWLPYVAGIGLQERLAFAGPYGPLLVLSSLLLAWPVGRWLARRGRQNPFGLALDRKTPLLIAGGVATMLALRALVLFVAEVTGAAVTGPEMGWGGAGWALISALVLGAVPALAEDIITRGFPIFAVRWRLRPVALIPLSAALYALNHIWRLDWGVSEQIRLFCMGIAYAAAAMRFRSLWAAFGLHVGWNAAGAMLPAEIDLTDLFRLIVAGAHLLLAFLLLFARGPNRDASLH